MLVVVAVALPMLGNIPEAAVVLPLRVSQEMKVAVLSVLEKSSVVTHNERLPNGGWTAFRDNDDGEKKDCSSSSSPSSSSSGKNKSTTANLSLQVDAVEIVRSLVNVLEWEFELGTWKSRREVVIVETALRTTLSTPFFVFSVY